MCNSDWTITSTGVCSPPAARLGPRAYKIDPSNKKCTPMFKKNFILKYALVSLENLVFIQTLLFKSVSFYSKLLFRLKGAAHCLAPVLRSFKTKCTNKVVIMLTDECIILNDWIGNTFNDTLDYISGGRHLLYPDWIYFKCWKNWHFPHIHAFSRLQIKEGTVK